MPRLTPIRDCRPSGAEVPRASAAADGFRPVARSVSARNTIATPRHHDRRCGRSPKAEARLQATHEEQSGERRRDLADAERGREGNRRERDSGATLIAAATCVLSLLQHAERTICSNGQRGV